MSIAVSTEPETLNKPAALAEPKIWKTYAAAVKQQGDETSHKFTFVFSSGDPDRDNDVIDQLGIDLKAFKDNAVVLWAHDMYTPPIAKVTSTWIRDGKLMGTIEFPETGISARSDEIRMLVSAGFINAVSIGFKPIEWTFDEERNGFNILKSELFELSLVPVPANQDALRQIAEKGLRMPLTIKWAEDLMKAVAEETKEVAVEPAPEPAPEPVPTPAPATPDVLAQMETKIAGLTSTVEALQLQLALAAAAKAATTVAIHKPVPKITTTVRKMNATEREYLKGAIKSALRDRAASEVRKHTGQLED
jgi:HK97 family phage prohead protease